MNEITADHVRASIVPKSDQLNADDLVAGPITVKITGVRVGDKDRPIFIDLDAYEKRPYKPCTMMRRLLVSVFGDEPKPWIGQRMTLFRDPQVQYKGDTVGGIRISHVSAITEPKNLILTEKRGRRIEWIVYPLDDRTDQQGNDEQIKQALAEIAATATEEGLKAVGFVLKQRPKAVQDAVRPSYAKRLKTLKDPPVSALQAFESEIEAAKGSRAALSKLSVRANEFDQAGPELLERIEGFYATAGE